MDKEFEKLFEKYFDLENFDGDKELMENFKKFFIDIMSVSNSKLQDVMESGKFNMNDDDIKDMIGNNKDVNSLTNEQTQGIIDKFDMQVKSINVNREPNMKVSVIKISEEWATDNSNYIIQQSYFLNILAFKERKYDVKLRTINELIDENLFNYKEHKIYMEELLEADKETYYKKLIDISLEYENYEDAAFYRDLMESK